MMLVRDILKDLERRAPASTAEKWDNVGLLVGDPAAKTPGAVISIDLTANVIREAKERGYKLIVNHHPCIFPKSSGLSRFVSGNLAFEAAREGISVVAKHTCFDQCALEVVEAVSAGLGVKALGRLFDRPEGELLKLVAFVPEKDADKVREAVVAAGAGQIGRYDSCTFSTPGTGTFRGGEGTNPHLGKPGTLERAQELRMETILPAGLRGAVIDALLNAHPYEEVAYDLYPVEQAPSPSGIIRGLGYGFWGDFHEPVKWSELNRRVLKTFGISGFWCGEPVPEKVKRIGFVAGKGSSFLGAAARAGCEVFITGEAGYHTVLDGMRRDVRIIEIGHRESELFFLRTQEAWLKLLGLETLVLNEPTQRIWVKGEPA